MLTTSSRPPEVAYITFDTQLLESVTAAIATTREFNTFDFGVTTEEMTVPPPTATPGAPFSEVTIGVISGVVLAALLIVLVIVLVCVFGRRRRDDPRPKRLETSLSSWPIIHDTKDHIPFTPLQYSKNSVLFLQYECPSTGICHCNTMQATP